MHFGYLNRNWVEEPSVPVGPSNSIEPGGPDRGQPTLLLHRAPIAICSRWPCPKDFGKKEVIWTLTVNGKTRESRRLAAAGMGNRPQRGGASLGGPTATQN